MRYSVALFLLLAPGFAFAQQTILSGAKSCGEAQRNCLKICQSYPGLGGSDCRASCAQARKECADTGCFNTGVQFDCGLKN